MKSGDVTLTGAALADCQVVVQRIAACAQHPDFHGVLFRGLQEADRARAVRELGDSRGSWSQVAGANAQCHAWAQGVETGPLPIRPAWVSSRERLRWTAPCSHVSWRTRVAFPAHGGAAPRHRRIPSAYGTLNRAAARRGARRIGAETPRGFGGLVLDVCTMQRLARRNLRRENSGNLVG